MQFLADTKLVEEVEAAEHRGEIEKLGGNRGNQHSAKIPNGNLGKATCAQAGLPPDKAIHEARKIRDAIKENPEVVNEVVADMIEGGCESSECSKLRRLRETVGGVFPPLRA